MWIDFPCKMWVYKIVRVYLFLYDEERGQIYEDQQRIFPFRTWLTKREKDSNVLLEELTDLAGLSFHWFRKTVELQTPNNLMLLDISSPGVDKRSPTPISSITYYISIYRFQGYKCDPSVILVTFGYLFSSGVGKLFLRRVAFSVHLARPAAFEKTNEFDIIDDIISFCYDDDEASTSGFSQRAVR